MTPIRKTILPLLSLALLSGAGCVSVQETSVTDVERAKVSFASDAAARTFYEAYSAGGDPREKSETRASVWLVLFSVEKKTVQGPNVHYNEAVRFCDTNGDREITEAEAEIFAREWPRFGGRK